MKSLGLIQVVMVSSVVLAGQMCLAASCDGLTATVYMQELPIEGHPTCDAAKALVKELSGLDSIAVRSEIMGCTRRIDRSRITDTTVSIRVQLDRKFAESSKLDGFDLGKRLWWMKDRYPSIKRVDVCRDVAFARP